MCVVSCCLTDCCAVLLDVNKWMAYRMIKRLLSWRNKFAGATAVYNFSVAGDEDHLQVKRNKWRVRMFFGFRF